MKYLFINKDSIKRTIDSRSWRQRRGRRQQEPPQLRWRHIVRSQGSEPASPTLIWVCPPGLDPENLLLSIESPFWSCNCFLTDSTSAPRSIQTTGKLGMSGTFARKGIVSSNLLKLLSCHFNVSALINGTFNWREKLHKSLSVSHLNPAVKLQSHSCAWLHIEVKSMLLWIWVEAGEVFGLALREVEVGVGESCGCTLTLRGNKNHSWLCEQPTW